MLEQNEILEDNKPPQEQDYSHERKAFGQPNTLEEHVDWTQQEHLNLPNTVEPQGTEDINDPDLQWAHLSGPGLDSLIAV